MSRFAGCARYVYNKALALKKELYEKKRESQPLPAGQDARALEAGNAVAFRKPQLTHYSKPFSTSTVPIRISLRSAPLSRSFTRKDCGMRSASLMRSASS